ncbi:MAG TPA: biotin/lipoyl-binding protein [Bryobacteraceae bacterium]|nr:biotin/lipoyl-binding protein [Bryobacteraceae bacterium]HOQ45742.1 biotin/lipoyl-binding protein [Bryobacteraceae bacterium]HPQ16096.1 biotin/lipoyl-binding protein [Bryobacteraceae bacterium]HPU71531.1 biotin/lipoyl-binding protein [Bryobacteraceae bacterium]
MRLKITIDGKAYEVDVEVSEEERRAGVPVYYPPRPTTALRSAPATPPPLGGGTAPAHDVADESKVCRAPVAGIVVRVNTHPGQQIQVNDPLLVLEAMKMETNITSPVAGTVKAVNANLGDAVKPGQVLVEFE